MSAVPSTAMGASIVPSTCCTPPSKRTSPSPVTREPGAKMVDPSIRRFAPPDSWKTPSESPPGGLPACIVRRPVSTSNSPRFATAYAKTTSPFPLLRRIVAPGSLITTP